MTSETPQTELQPHDLREAIGGLLVVLGTSLPQPMVRHMESMLMEFSARTAQSGKANVGMLLQDFAQALAEGANAPGPGTH